MLDKLERRIATSYLKFINLKEWVLKTFKISVKI